MLCAICANKVVWWKLYKDIKGGLFCRNFFKSCFMTNSLKIIIKII